VAERRTMIIGLDALTPELTWPWAAEGVLPNMARIMGRGASGPLRSTLPPWSPAAWSTFATGKNPGKHGIIGFQQFTHQDYRPRLMSAADRAGVTFWEIAGRHGIRGGIINLPVSFPPRPFNGFMITGMMTPGLGRRMASPPEVFDDLIAASPDYAIDISMLGTVGEPPARALRRVLDNLQARCKAAVSLYRKHRPPLFCVVFVAADRVSHFFWPYMEAARSGRPLTAEKRRLADAVRTTYAALDEAVGSLMAEAGPDTDVVVLSDHGAGPLHSGLSLRKALAEADLLAEMHVGRLRCWRRWAIRAVARGLPYRFKRALPLLLPGVTRRLSGLAAAGSVDYRRSLAYPLSSVHGIFVNVRGRQPWGIVEPGAEYEDVRERVISVLLQVRDPRTGRPVLRAVHRREDVWSGERLEQLPDLVVEPEDYGHVMQTFGEDPGGEVIYRLPEMDWGALQHLGGHRPDGILLAVGPHVRHTQVKGAAIVDVPATVLALLGCPIPEDFDGRVLSEMLTDDVPTLSHEAPAGPEASPADALTSRDEAVIKQRLDGLGYA
jgi:predicted AlkP superfamily phosphohydrolase/phosphomutase